ncbi:PGPGW domain-containing protein [Pseudoalteromonas denitrificans]|uniref:Putative transmembrane protein (PGPGW) n=1 Tax=Pseudoalteromonas denitrificans DSM 6059 TaxID=1123010 RepID=A0A1I1FPM5_9GAMM|nr:PGPGW domain-containing protein [Pseudoalteromonas denitrificans]SFC00952.1 Putative transmembrane protein (PGPGW) [Pseudoalteromonas denitrificans DSM 6059]
MKKLAITLMGGILLLIGLIFIILPGPAIIFIPIALVLLSKEYPVAKVWLSKFQRFSRKGAVKLDQFFSKK